MSSSPLRSSAIMKEKITYSLKPPLMKTRSVFNVFLVLCVWSPRKSKFWYFFCFFPRAKVEAHFLKKIAFVTRKCLAQSALGKCPRTTENLWKYTAVLNSCVHKFSYLVCTKNHPSKWAISVTKMHCPIYAVPKLTQKYFTWCIY